MKIKSVLLVVLLLAAAASTVCAAPNIFGVSGILELPDDTVLAPGSVSIGYHRLFDSDTNAFTGTIGVIPNLEVGVGFFDPENSDSATLLNAKYRVLAETIDRPAVTVGVVDLAEDLNLPDDDPSLFILISKTLTSAAEDITGEPSKPLRGHIGFGTGVYDGLIAGLNWTFLPKLQIGVEYLNEGLNDNDFNALLRYALTSEVRVDVGTIDFDDWTVGLSYTSLRF